MVSYRARGLLCFARRKCVVVEWESSFLEAANEQTNQLRESVGVGRQHH